MTDFLLELRSEEIPARMQENARAVLETLFINWLELAGIDATTESFSTPRRLALIIRDLPAQTAEVSEEVKGPRVGSPPQALEGFLRKTGLAQDQLEDRDGVWFAVIEKPGRATAEVLAEAIPAIVRAFPWPKSMRWGAASLSTESLRWVRPLQGIVALLGDEVVPFEIDGVASGSATLGHRFHHSGPVTIGNAGDYLAKLNACHVIVDQEERRAIIRAGAEKAAADAGLVLVPDEGLVIENAGLTEWPVPMLGRFDPAFLEVPEEVIQLTARVNQKYFVCHDAGGKLANAFVCTANIWGPSPTRSSASRSLPAGWWRKAWSTARAPTMPNARRASPRPISSPGWSANSPNCKGSWAAITPAHRARATPSPTPCAITMESSATDRWRSRYRSATNSTL